MNLKKKLFYFLKCSICNEKTSKFKENLYLKRAALLYGLETHHLEQKFGENAYPKLYV